MTLKIAVILFICTMFLTCAADQKQLKSIEDRLEDKICKYAFDITKFLEEYNDKHLGNSEIGRLLGYMDIKPKYNEEIGRNGKAMKKMSMALMPLLFHIGASSTWMLITTLLAAKSVGIGLLLLVFKIAVSSAKVASYFTALKAKHHHEYSWSPPVEHGHYRSIDQLDTPHAPSDWHTPHYTPEWINEAPTNDYKTIPVYERISKNIHELAELSDSSEYSGES